MTMEQYENQDFVYKWECPGEKCGKLILARKKSEFCASCHFKQLTEDSPPVGKEISDHALYEVRIMKLVYEKIFRTPKAITKKKPSIYNKINDILKAWIQKLPLTTKVKPESKKRS